MNNNFYNPGNLGNDAFKSAEDLSSDAFKKAGNLDSSAFKPAGDLDSTESNSFKFNQPKNITADEIKSYIASVQTGTKTSGVTSGGGCMMVTFDRFKNMVNDGYNIIRADYFEQMGMIEVEFDIPMNYKCR